MLGTVKWFSPEKGYGFIAQDDGSDDLFFHSSECGGGQNLQSGDKVSFTVKVGQNGRDAAVGVRFVSRPAKHPAGNVSLPKLRPPQASESGVIKWFSEAKGYGFLIGATDSDDLFFHIRDYTGSAQPKLGDKVSYVIGAGKDGRVQAKCLRFISGGERHDHRPYYGKPTEKTTHGGVGGAAIGLVLGSALGPVGAVIGAIIGGSFRDTRKINDTCLRCGGVGNVTAITPQYIGFQCEKCRAFWKKRNHENLTLEQVSQTRS